MTIFTIQLPYSKISQRWLLGPKPVLMSVSLCSSCLLQVPKSISNGRWFEPKGISYLVGVIVQMRVVFRKTVSGDWSFNCLSDSYLQSQGKSRCQMMVCISKLKYSTLRKIVSAELLTTEGNKWEPHKEFTAGRDTIKICSWGEGGKVVHKCHLPRTELQMEKESTSHRHFPPQQMEWVELSELFQCLQIHR